MYKKFSVLEIISKEFFVIINFIFGFLNLPLITIYSVLIIINKIRIFFLIKRNKKVQKRIDETQKLIEKIESRNAEIRIENDILREKIKELDKNLNK